MEPVRYQHGVMRANNTRYGFKIIKFCQGKIAQRAFHAFVALDPQNLAYFENRYKPETCRDFSAFGTEILRGWGLTPSEDIIEHLKSKHNIEFGVDPDYLLHLSGLTLQAEKKDSSSSFSFPETSHDYGHVKEYPEKPAEALGS